jgi:hypothetical protein
VSDARLTIGHPAVDCHCGHPLVWRNGRPWCSVYGTHPTPARTPGDVFNGAHNRNAPYANLVIELDALPSLAPRAIAARNRRLNTRTRASI